LAGGGREKGKRVIRVLGHKACKRGAGKESTKSGWKKLINRPRSKRSRKKGGRKEGKPEGVKRN